MRLEAVNKKIAKKLGHHFIVELCDCNPALLDDVEFIETIMVASANACGATVITHSFHKFEPVGVSGAVVLAESHITLHSWPEEAYAAVDLFTCGDHTNPQIAFEYLQEKVESKTCLVSEVNRGVVLANECNNISKFPNAKVNEGLTHYALHQ